MDLINLNVKELKEILPIPVMDIARRLLESRFKAYLVGGSLRDILLGNEVKDYDIATDATPEEIVRIFPKSLEVGAKFGTVIVLSSPLGLEDNTEQHKEYEVTTFRSESQYINGRWPEKVTFTKTIEEDLSRRDFTINALALDLNILSELGEEELVNKYIIDPFGGVHDIGAAVIKAVGDPNERMKEDNLRSLRGCRLACKLGFTIESETFEAIKNTASTINQISMERVRDEFTKILDCPIPSIGIELLRRSNILEVFIPELLEGIGMEQNSYHTYDLYNHLLKSCDIADKKVRLVSLFHDIGKSRTKDGEHFYGHDLVGAEMSKDILKRMKFPKATVEKVSKLIALHMFNYSKEWSDSAVRRFYKKVGSYDMLEELFLLRIADSLGNPKSDYDPSELRDLQERIIKVEEEDNALHVRDLKINGDDLIIMGFQKGPQIGNILDELLEKVLDEPSLNEKNKLVQIIQQNYLNK